MNKIIPFYVYTIIIVNQNTVFVKYFCEKRLDFFKKSNILLTIYEKIVIIKAIIIF